MIRIISHHPHKEGISQTDMFVLTEDKSAEGLYCALRD